MDLKGIMLFLCEISQTEKHKYYITYMQILKNNTNESTYKTETDAQVTKGEKERERDKLGVWD